MNKEHTHNDPGILSLVASGSEEAFRQLYDTWHPKVYSLSMYLTRSAFMSEEITQEVFVKIWNSRHQLTGIDYFASWIRTIARNTIINYLRLKAREKLALLSYYEATSGHNQETADTLSDREYARLLHELVDALPPQQKKVWLLTREEGLTLARAAEKMGVTRHTAKEHLSRAVHAIRARLDGHIELVVTAALTLFL